MDVLDALKADVGAAPSTEILATIDRIAAESGVHPKVLRNIVYNATHNPRYNNICKLQAYYAKKPRES